MKLEFHHSFCLDGRGLELVVSEGGYCGQGGLGGAVGDGGKHYGAHGGTRGGWVATWATVPEVGVGKGEEERRVPLLLFVLEIFNNVYEYFGRYGLSRKVKKMALAPQKPSEKHTN